MIVEEKEFEFLAPECDNCERLKFNNGLWHCDVLGVRKQFDPWCSFAVPVELSKDIEYHDLSG